MNKFITLFILLLCIVSCSNNERYKEVMESVTAADYDAVSTEDAYSILISEKLQEYFEKQKIIKNHPEFESNLTTNSSLLLMNDSIIDISIIDNIPSPDFDSISLKTVISYYNNTQKDTILSKIKRSRIVIEGEQIISSKVRFEENEE